MLLQLCSTGMVQLILNDGIRRKVWAALYEEKLSKKECVEKFSSVIGKTQLYELFKEFECAYSFERRTKEQKREDAGLCARGLPAEVLPKLLDVITEDPDRTYKAIKKVLADDHNIVLSVPQICELINTPKSRGGLGWSQTVKQRLANEKDQGEREAFREFAHVTIPPEDIGKVITFDEMHRGKNEGKKKKSLSPVGQKSTHSESFSADVRQTFCLIAALTINGCVQGTAWTSSDNVDADMFYIWVLFHLVPVLGDYALGQQNSIVWCDNVIQHLDDRSKKAIRDTGAILVYLPRFQSFSVCVLCCRLTREHATVAAGFRQSGIRSSPSSSGLRTTTCQRSWILSPVPRLPKTVRKQAVMH